MTLLSKPSDLVMDAAKLGADLVSHGVIPIFRRDDRDAPDFEGSGVLLRIGTHHFLLSAAHVFDRCDDTPFLLLDGVERDSLSGKPFKTSLPPGGRDADRLDVGFVLLTEAETSRFGADAFFDLKDLNLRESQSSFGQYFLLGYPGKLQERKDARLVYATNGAYFVTLPAAGRGYTFCKLSRDANLLLSYKKNKVVLKGGGPVPPFSGMSGGGVFKINALHPPRPDNLPRLIGLTVEQPPCFAKSILVVRIEVVLFGIKEHFPKIARLIPESGLLSAKAQFVAPPQ